MKRGRPRRRTPTGEGGPCRPGQPRESPSAGGRHDQGAHGEDEGLIETFGPAHGETELFEPDAVGVGHHGRVVSVVVSEGTDSRNPPPAGPCDALQAPCDMHLGSQDHPAVGGEGDAERGAVVVDVDDAHRGVPSRDQLGLSFAADLLSGGATRHGPQEQDQTETKPSSVSSSCLHCPCSLDDDQPRNGPRIRPTRFSPSSGRCPLHARGVGGGSEPSPGVRGTRRSSPEKPSQRADGAGPPQRPASTGIVASLPARPMGKSGGEGGIRTHGMASHSPDFESGPFNRTPAPLRGRGG